MRILINLLLTFILILSQSDSFAYSITNSNSEDSLTVTTIDSILDTFKGRKVGKKILETDFNINYHYDRKSGKCYLIAVYGSEPKFSVTLFYYIQNQLCKIVYLERKHKEKSVYYFSNSHLISKVEAAELVSQDTDQLQKFAERFYRQCPSK